MSKEAVERYFAAFNRGDVAAMVDELTDDVAHHVNEGRVRHGTELFRSFCQHMAACYREELTDIVILMGEDGTRAAA